MEEGAISQRVLEVCLSGWVEGMEVVGEDD